MTGGYGPTNSQAYQQQQNTGANQNSFNKQASSVGGSSPQNYFNFMQRSQMGRQKQRQPGQAASVSTNPSQGQMTPPQGIQSLQSPVMANGQMSVQPLSWQSPQQQQFGQLRQSQGTDASKVPQEYKSVADAYLKNLGRIGSMPEWQTWAPNPNFQQGIAGSEEAKLYQDYQKQVMDARNAFPVPQLGWQQNITPPSVNGQAWNPLQGPQGLNNATYNPATFNQQFSQYNGDPNSISQFQAPNQQGIDNQQQQMIQNMLSNPHTMNDQAVAALKAKQQETALALQRSQLGNVDAGAAARGVTGGGPQAAQQNQVRNQTGQNILSSYRDIDLAKLEQDRLDEVGALNSANQFQNSQMNRGVQGYNATLAGQTAREGVAVDAANSAQRAEGMRLGQDQANANEQWQKYQSLGNQDAQNLGVWNQQNSNYFNLLDGNQRQQQIGLQGWLGAQGIGLDRDRLDTSKDQFNKGYGLDIANFLEGRRQFDKSLGQSGSNFNNNMAYQYALLNSNNTNNTMDFYRSLFGAV
jgi:hypothetical protein